MIELRESREGELQAFADMETDADAAEYILPYSLARHRQEFAREDIVYLSIINNRELAGFFILALEDDGHSVEFRRIVVAAKNAGIGQQAISSMQDYCRDRLDRERIWLDVFEHNSRGRHIYRKLGYVPFDRAELNGKPLLFMQKLL